MPSCSHSQNFLYMTHENIPTVYLGSLTILLLSKILLFALSSVFHIVLVHSTLSERSNLTALWTTAASNMNAINCFLSSALTTRAYSCS